MKFGTRSSPRVKVVVGCLRSELVDEVMSSVAKTPIRGESDRFEVDVELLVASRPVQLVPETHPWPLFDPL